MNRRYKVSSSRLEKRRRLFEGPAWNTQRKKESCGHIRFEPILKNRSAYQHITYDPNRRRIHSNGFAHNGVPYVSEENIRKYNLKTTINRRTNRRY
jgi:hypothetical protein